jgi:nucleotide-binding universal stress UspA family protein
MFRNILVAVDGSPTSIQGLRTAIELAADQRATLHVVHVVDDLAAMPSFEGSYVPATYVDTLVDSLRQAGERVLARAQKQAAAAGVEARVHAVESLGRPVAQAVLKQARKVHADVIVLGTHGRRGLRRVLLGSDAESVLREATCPVLLVRDTREAGATGKGKTAKGAARKATTAKPRARKATRSATGATAPA